MILGQNWIEQLDANATALGLTDTAICLGGKAPEDLEANREFHKKLVADLVEEVRRRGWPGAEFCFYMRREGYVSIYAAPSSGGVLTLAGLSDHREAQKRADVAPPEMAAVA